MARVLVILAEGCEELEAVTVIDLLRRAEVEVVTAGLSLGLVRASRGVVLAPDAILDSVLEDSFDMVVLPGGMPGAKHLEEDARVLKLIQDLAAGGQYVAAICAAPRVLAVAGLLEGKRATAYPGFLDGGDFPGVSYTGSALEEDGRIITSRGPGTAMDFALHLIALLCGAATRERVEAGLLRPQG